MFWRGDMTKWILIVFALTLSDKPEVERIATFETKTDCEAAGEQLKTALQRRNTTKFRWVCIQGE